MERSNYNIIERTTGKFKTPIMYEDLIEKYLPYLKENIPDSKVTFRFDSLGEITNEKRKPRITSLIAFVSKGLTQLPIEFRSEVHMGEDIETNEDVWGITEYNLVTTPGYTPLELPEKDLELIDQVKDLTDKFSL